MLNDNGFEFSEDGKILISYNTALSVENIEVPFGTEIIKDKVFFGCNAKSITLPDSVIKIGERVFASSPNLFFVHLPCKLTSLSDYAFEDCKNLAKIDMPYNVESFPEGLFSGCEILADIPFRAGITELPKNVTKGCNAIKSLLVPSGVTSIKAEAVSNCASLSTIVLPESLTTIEENAFLNCPQLKHIRFADENPFFFVDEDSGCLFARLPEKHFRLILCPAATEDLFLIKGVSEIDDSVFENSSIKCVTLEEADPALEQMFKECLPEMKLQILGQPLEKSIAETPVVETLTPVVEDVMPVVESTPVVEDESIEEEPVIVAEPEAPVAEEATPAIVQETPVVSTPVVETQMLRFAKGMKDVAKHFLCCNVECSEESRQFGDFSELYVIAENVSKETGSFSESLIKFSKRLSLKYGFTKIYFFEGMPEENDEFMYGLEVFLFGRNTVYACNAKRLSELNISEKKYIKACSISLEKKDVSEEKKSIENKKVNLPVKILVQDIVD